MSNLIMAKLIYQNQTLRDIPFDIETEDNKEYYANLIEKQLSFCNFSNYDYKKSFYELQQNDQTNEDKVICQFYSKQLLSKHCEHDFLQAELFCKECNLYFKCIKCHQQTHLIDISKIKCCTCGEEQPISQFCKRCNQEFASYYDKKNQILTQFHQSKPINKKQSDLCPICQGDLNEFMYRKLGCSHQVHCHCLYQHQKQQNNQCPVCRTIFDVNKSNVEQKIQMLFNHEFIQTKLQRAMIEVPNWVKILPKQQQSTILEMALEEGVQDINWDKFKY